MYWEQYGEYAYWCSGSWLFSENIALLRCLKKSCSKQIIFSVKIIHIITFCFIALFDIKLDRLSTLKWCFNKIMVNISQDTSLLFVALNVTLRKKEKRRGSDYHFVISFCQWTARPLERNSHINNCQLRGWIYISKENLLCTNPPVDL